MSVPPSPTQKFFEFLTQIDWDKLRQEYNLDHVEFATIIDGMSVARQEDEYYNQTSWDDQFRPQYWAGKLSLKR